MARALGVNAQLCLKDEVAFGTAATGNYNKLPFVSADYGAEQKLIADDTIGHGREPIDPSQDVIDVQHNVSVPVDLNNIGYWLKGLFGAATDTGTSPHCIHTFQSGSLTLPSRSIEIGFTDIGQYFLKTGAVVGSMEFDFKPSGNVSASVTLIAQNDVRSTSTGAGTPTSQVFKRFSQFTGSILRNGSAIAGITEAKLKIDNKLDGVHVIRDDGLVEGIDPLMMEVTGTITARFEDATLIGDAESFTPDALTLGWEIDTNNLLTFSLPRVYLPRPKSSVSGPGGLSVSYDFQAAHDPTDGYLLQAVLKNAVETY